MTPPVSRQKVAISSYTVLMILGGDNVISVLGKKSVSGKESLYRGKSLFRGSIVVLFQVLHTGPELFYKPFY